MTGAAFDQIRRYIRSQSMFIVGHGNPKMNALDALRMLEREHEQLRQLADALERTDGALRAVLARKPVRDADEILVANAWLLFPAPVAVEVPADE